MVDHAANAAEDIFERFSSVVEENRSVIESDRRLRVRCEEVSGLLDGMMQRRIRSGTVHLSTSLHEIIEKWPQGEPVDELFYIAGDCMNFGLSLEGIPLGPYSGQTHSRGFSK